MCTEPIDPPRSLLKMLEWELESQAAFNHCWAGPSSVMNASDLDELTVEDEHPFGIGVKTHGLMRQEIQS